MGFLLLAAFIGIPILEIAVFIQAGEWIGLWPTVSLVVLTAVIGAALVRHQGLATLMRAHRNLDQGIMPVAEAFDGICLVIAGALLLTPGFITDGVGFALLVPPLRAALRVWLLRVLKDSGRFHVHRGPARGATVIDGEFHEVGDPAANETTQRAEPDPDEVREIDERPGNPDSPWGEDRR